MPTSLRLLGNSVRFEIPTHIQLTSMHCSITRKRFARLALVLRNRNCPISIRHVASSHGIVELIIDGYFIQIAFIFIAELR